MNYIDVEFEEVEGFENLSKLGKYLFEKVYKLHNSMQGLDYKKEWIPIKVIEHKTYLKVYFKNGEWLHYYTNGTWG